MQNHIPKQYLTLNHAPLFTHALRAFLNVRCIERIFFVYSAHDSHFAAYAHLPLFQSPKLQLLPCGGETRAQSIANALNQTALNSDDWVLVHDAARALITSEDILHLIQTLKNHKIGGILAQPLSDTLKQVSDHNVRTLPRHNLWQAQTPQMFRYALLKKALHHPNELITDESSAIEQLGLAPQMVQNSACNFKITYPEDLTLAEYILKGKSMHFRIGQGFDLHALEENRDLIIAGVKIPFHKGLKGHSDADVLLHALIDALLGAAALGDIGQHFPDSDPQFKNANSRILLKQTHHLIQQAGFQIVNIDSTIIAEKPKLKDYLLPMRKNIAQDLNLNLNQISIKAKTNEKLGFLGEEKGIEARAVILLNQIQNI